MAAPGQRSVTMRQGTTPVPSGSTIASLPGAVDEYADAVQKQLADLEARRRGEHAKQQAALQRRLERLGSNLQGTTTQSSKAERDLETIQQGVASLDSHLQTSKREQESRLQDRLVSRQRTKTQLRRTQTSVSPIDVADLHQRSRETSLAPDCGAEQRHLPQTRLINAQPAQPPQPTQPAQPAQPAPSFPHAHTQSKEKSTMSLPPDWTPRREGTWIDESAGAGSGTQAGRKLSRKMGKLSRKELRPHTALPLSSSAGLDPDPALAATVANSGASAAERPSRLKSARGTRFLALGKTRLIREPTFRVESSSLAQHLAQQQIQMPFSLSLALLVPGLEVVRSVLPSRAAWGMPNYADLSESEAETIPVSSLLEAFLQQLSRQTPSIFYSFRRDFLALREDTRGLLDPDQVLRVIDAHPLILDRLLAVTVLRKLSETNKGRLSKTHLAAFLDRVLDRILSKFQQLLRPPDAMQAGTTKGQGATAPRILSDQARPQQGQGGLAGSQSQLPQMQHEKQQHQHQQHQHISLLVAEKTTLNLLSAHTNPADREASVLSLSAGAMQQHPVASDSTGSKREVSFLDRRSSTTLEMVKEKPENVHMPPSLCDCGKNNGKFHPRAPDCLTIIEESVVDDDEVDPFAHETRQDWLDRFDHLRRALWRCEIGGLGVGSTEDAKRLATHYSELYDLDLATHGVDGVLSRLSLPNMTIPLGEFLDQLVLVRFPPKEKGAAMMKNTRL